VAAGVVDDLELVQVDVEQGPLVRHHAGAGEQLFEPPFELAPVHEARERIVAGLPGELLHVVLLARHIVQHQHGPGQHALVVDGRAHDLDRNRAVVVAPQVARVAIALRGRAIEHAFEEFPRAGQLGVVAELQHGGQGLSLHVGRGAGQQQLGGRVHVDHQALGVGGDHAVADRGERGVGALALGAQHVLHALALREELVVVHQRDQDEQGGRAQVGPHQQRDDAARTLSQLVAERAGCGRDGGVDAVDLLSPGLADFGCRRAGLGAGVDLLPELP